VNEKITIILLVVFGVVTGCILQFESGFPGNSLDYFFSLIAVSLTIIASWNVGNIISKLISISVFPWSKYLVGFAIISIIPMLLGMFGILYIQIVILPLFILPLMMSPTKTICALKKLNSDIKNLMTVKTHLTKFMLFIILLSLIWTLFSTFVPITGKEALTNNLGPADQSIVRKSIFLTDYSVGLPVFRQYQMLVLPIIALDRNGIAVNILGFFFAFLIAWIASSILNERCDIEDRLISFGVIITSPIILFLLLTTSSYLLSTAYTLAAIHGLFFSKSGNGWRYSVWHGLLVSSAVAINPSSLFVFLPVALVFSFRRFSFSTIFKIIIVSSIFPLFWIFINYFSGTYSFKFSEEFSIGNILTRINSLMKGFVVFNFEELSYPLGAVFLILIFISIFSIKNNSILRKVVIAGFISIASWLILGSGNSIELLPLFVLWPVLAIDTGFVRNRLLKICIAIALLINFSSGVLFSEKTHSFIQILTSKIDPVFFVAKWNRTYVPQRAGNEMIPESAKVLSFGEKSLFYLHRYAVVDGFGEKNLMLKLAHSSHDADSLRKELIEKGFTHILYLPISLRKELLGKESAEAQCGEDEKIILSMIGKCKTIIREENMLGLYELTERREQ